MYTHLGEGQGAGGILQVSAVVNTSPNVINVLLFTTQDTGETAGNTLHVEAVWHVALVQMYKTITIRVNRSVKNDSQRDTCHRERL